MSLAFTQSAPTAATPSLPGPLGASRADDGIGRSDDDRALDTARAFEKLLIHGMLKTMRRSAAVLGETPSNARSTYDDMLDEHLAGVMSEAGGIGLATALAEALRSTTRPDAARSTGVPGLPAADVLRLRALTLDGGGTRGETIAAPSLSSGAGAIRTRVVRQGVAPGMPVDAERQRAFIRPLLPHAHASARRLGTSPDAVLAIAALESGWGDRVAADEDGRSSHNLFGIKARRDEPDAIAHRTAEYVDGERRHVIARFRAFASPAAAVSGFADFVLGNPRYAPALEHAADPSEFLRRLQTAGYATDPRYADKAIAVMQRVRALRESLS